jgi:DNA-binding NtrC family response regulator
MMKNDPDANHEITRALRRAEAQIGEALQEDELSRAVGEAGTTLLGAHVGLLGLVDGDKDEIAFLGGAPASVSCRVPLGRGIVGWLADGGKPIIANDLQSDPRVFDGEDQLETHGVDSLLAVPLRREGPLVGVIVALNSRREGGFKEDDAERASALSGAILVALERIARVSRLRASRDALADEQADPGIALLGSSLRTRQLVEMARQAAPGNVPILLTGERGAGHEELARTLHRWSPRREGPFVSLRCAGLTPEQLGLALFGRVSALATEEPSDLRGAIDRARGGTLFIGELGALPPAYQLAVLRVVEEETWRPMGSDEDRRADVRLIASTTRDLRSQIRRGAFNQDLYYRLCTVAIELPSLRERREDIPLLAEKMVEQLCRRHDRPSLRIGPAALGCLVGHDWPGNLSELANTLERAVLLTRGEGIGVRVLPPEVRGWNVEADAPDLPGFDDEVPLSRAVEKFKSDRILRALEQTGGNQTRAARLLGLQQSNLSRMMKNLGIR